MTEGKAKLSTSQIKDVISNLVTVLNCSGFHKTSSEIFRQAKFAKPDAVRPLLILTSELLHFQQHGDLLKISGDQSCGPWCGGKAEAFIIAQCLHIGYPGSIHIAGHTSGEAEVCSRKLLLLIGWLIGSKKILSRIIHEEIAVVQSCIPRNIGKDDDIQEKDNFTKSSFVPGENLTTDQVAKQLSWYVGRTTIAQKKLYWKHQEMVKLFHKIHKFTEGVSFSDGRAPHMTMAEVDMIRNSSAIAEFCQLLRKENQRLNAYLHWQEKENIFWDWMGSVVDAEKKSNQQDSNGHEMCVALEAVRELLGEKVVELQNLIHGLEQNISLVTSKKHDIDRPVSFRGKQYCQELNPNKLSVEVLSIPRLHYTPENATRQSGCQDDRVKNIKDEILHLSNAVRTLENDLHQQRACFTKKCNEVLVVKDDIVSIPPFIMKDR